MRNQDKLLDRHKIASCITHAIIKVGPFQPELIENPSFNQRVINYSLGIYSGLMVMVDMIKEKAVKDNDSLLEQIFSKDLIYPKPVDASKTYIDYLVKSLARAHVNKENNITLLAHIYFFVEKYHEAEIRSRLSVTYSH